MEKYEERDRPKIEKVILENIEYFEHILFCRLTFA